MKFKKPILLLGQGAKGSRYRELAEANNIPVITSRLGVDLLEYDHSLFVGHPGNYGDIASKKAIDNADLIVVIGCRLASALVGYSPEEWGKQACKIVVDIDKKELEKTGVDIQDRICADSKDYWFKLDGDHSKWVKQCQEWKYKYPVVTKEHKKTLNSYSFVDKLSANADKDDIVLLDTGSCFHTVCQAWKLKRGQRFITTGGLSSMGWWAASLGAGVIGRTICITGDGSLQMNIQELATIKHNNLPIKLFVLNNDGYGLIRATQDRFMEGRHIGESPETGVWFPDLKKIANAYGIRFTRTRDISDVDDAIELTLMNDDPVICEIMIPKCEKLLRPSEIKI